MNNKGFTLLELVVIVSIIAILLVPITKVYTKIINNAKISATKNIINKLVASFKLYYKSSHSIPRPADITIAYGERKYNQSYRLPDNLDNQKIIKSNNKVVSYYGAVPTDELDINPKYMLDKWGNKFSYFVTKKISDGASRDYIEHYKNTMFVKEKNSLVDDGYVLVIISHGKNAKGAYNKLGEKQPLEEATDDDIRNIKSIFTGTDKKYNYFVQNEKSDDILGFLNIETIAPILVKEIKNAK